jgi:hypothetical protein
VEQLTHQEWWQLHLRIARGEALSGTEQEAYDSFRHELEQDDVLPAMVSARMLRKELQSLEGDYEKLEKQRRQLDVEIARLESELSDPTREYLSAED